MRHFGHSSLCIVHSALCIALAAALAFGENVVTPRYYVGDSLVGLYDGVYNATNAAGELVHDSSATKWLDLSGNGRDFTVEAGGSWTATTFEFNALSATLTPAMPYYYTQEIRCQVDSGRWVFFGPGANGFVMQGLVTVSGETKKFQTAFDTAASVDYKWLDAGNFTAPFTTAVTYNNVGSGSAATYCNAQTTPSYTGHNRWALYNTSASIGAWAGNNDSRFYCKGRIQSIRLYSRVLTAEEMAHNYLVDRIRFEGADPPAALAPVVSCSQVAGVGPAGGAVVEVAATSLGWLGSSLASVSVECSASSDFSSSTLFPAILAADGMHALATLSGLEAGGTYYVRALAANDLGASSASAAATIAALSSSSTAPYGAQLLSATADSAVSASLDVAVGFIPAGATCDIRAVVTDGFSTWTNVLAAGVSAPGAATYALTHLHPGTGYNVFVFASCGASASEASAPLSFTTPALDITVTAYAQNGLILMLDAICNATNAAGVPTHNAGASTWTDLTGNHATAFGGNGKSSISFKAAAVSFPASQAYLEMAAADVSDAAVDGDFTVEATAKLAQDSTSNNQLYGLYSLGSGSSSSPRTICFDLRFQSPKRGVIQYNCSGWPSENVRLPAYPNNSSTIPATYALSGGGAVGSDASFYHLGDFIQKVKNWGAYTSSSSISKTLRVRHYGDAYAQTDYYAFRAYNRSLSGAELALNAQIDGVRFFGNALPSPLEPSVSFLPVDNGVSGEAYLVWTLDSVGWPAASLASLTLEYAASPDFADAAVATLAQNVSADGTATLTGLVPGQTYWARALAVNNLGNAAPSDVFSFTAATGEAASPVFIAGDVSPAPASATFQLTLTTDGGSACGGYAVLSGGGHVATNALFSGVRSPYAATLELPLLLPATAYTATISVTNAAGAASEAATLSFATGPDTSFVCPYVTNGLIAVFDAICNATNAAGLPTHSDSPAAWTDLMGNFATVDNGTVVYSATGVTYSAAVGSYTSCEEAAAAVDAIVSGNFTVESLCAFDQRPGNEDYWGFFSFGSGSEATPRILNFDGRYLSNKYGAIHYNRSGWHNNALLPGALDFSRMATYSIVGGGTSSANGALYVDGAYECAVLNGGAYTTSSTYDKRFAIRRYSNKQGAARFHSFRIYNRNLTADEIAQNRLADEVRYLGSPATLTVTSATRDGDTLVATLARTVDTMPAAIVLHACADYGDYASADTGYAFAADGATASVTVAIPAGANYIRFSAGALVSDLLFVADIDVVGGVSVGAPSATDAGINRVTVSAPVVVPMSSGPVALYAAYGYAPDALVWTNALPGASSVTASGVASGVLDGLVPNRTYYLRVFGVADGAVVDGPADAFAVFTTALPPDESSATISVTATNYVDGYISSVVADVTCDAVVSLWLFADAVDQGILSNDWAYAEKVADIPAGGGTCTASVPPGWGTSLFVFRLATLADGVECVTNSARAYVDTGYPLSGSARVDIDVQLLERVPQARLFSCGNDGRFIYQCYINTYTNWAYAWNASGGNWINTGIPTDTGRHSISMDGRARVFTIDGATINLSYSYDPRGRTSSNNLHLLCEAIDLSNSMKAALYGCAVRDSDGATLLGDYRPATYGGAACLYDAVSRQCVHPKGGAFDAGAPNGIHYLVDPSPPFYRVDALAPALGSDVVVTGHETGDTITLFGTSANATRVTVNGQEAVIGADGSWSVTLTDVEPGVASPYDVRAWSASGALDALPTFYETTRAASAIGACSASSSQRSVSFRGILSTHGANTTTVTLLTGPSAAALTNTLTAALPALGDASFSFDWHAPAFYEAVYWAIAIENAATDPANGHWFSTNAVATITPFDAATYTWRAADGDWAGDWSDSAHWADNTGGDCIGWPSRSDAIAVINQGRITMDTSVTVRELVFGADGTVAIRGGGTLTVAAAAYTNIKRLMVPDGADIVLENGANVVLRCYVAIAATNAQQTAYAATFAVTDGSTLTATDFSLSRGGVLLVDDATASLTGIYLNAGCSANNQNAFLCSGGTVRLQGDSPRINLSNNLRNLNNPGTSDGGTVEFRVPRNGYAAPPIVMTGTGNGQTFCGDANVAQDSAPVHVRIAADSPLYGTTGTLDLVLATWARKHTDAAALVDLVQPRGAGRDPKRRLFIADDDLSLRLQFHGGFTVILVR